MVIFPSWSSLFVGRQEELATLSNALADPACRLLTLVGPGGIGKTRLAVELACVQLDQFPDAAYFVSLQALGSPQLIVPAIAETLNHPVTGANAPLQQLLDDLSHQSCLLVLDNFEHLLDGAALIAEILHAAPDVKILITSRERLNLLEEWVVEVEGLPVPVSTTETDLETFSAVQLFIQSARRVQAGFRLTSSRQAAVARICRAVGGMPLGIELAAAWVRVLPCEQLADEIERSLEILETPTRNALPRHRTMRAAFAPTWERLNDAERAVFTKLSVFRGGFTFEAAHVVAGASRVTLSSLVDKSLLRLDAQERYHLHELLRQYGEEQLAELGNSDQVLDAHSAFYTDFCDRHKPDIQGLRQLEALDEIEADFENVRTAWLRAVERRNEDALARALESLYLYCEMRTRWDEAYELMQRASAQFAPGASEVPRPLWGKLLARLGYFWQETFEQRRERREQALAIARQWDNRAEIGYCLWRLGELANDGDDYSSAIPFLEESLAHFRMVTDPYYVAKVLNELAITYRELGQFEKALDFSQQSLVIRREVRDDRGAGWCLFDMGRSFYSLGRYTQAAAHFEEALALWRQLNDRYGIRAVVELLSMLALLKGDFARARSLSEESITLGTDLRVLQTHPGALFHLAVLTSMAGDYTKAEQLFQQGFDFEKRMARGMEIHWEFALAAYGRADYPAAKRLVLDVYSQSQRLSYLNPLFVPMPALILAHENQPVRAAELLGSAFNQSEDAIGWLHKWSLVTRLRADLEAQLGTDAYTEAWERGTASSLDTLIAAFMEYFQPDDAPRLVPQSANRALIEPLSERELEVLRLIARGLSNPEIADRLVVGVTTVKKHINHLYGKLGVQNRTQALIRAREWQLV